MGYPFPPTNEAQRRISLDSAAPPDDNDQQQLNSDDEPTIQPSNLPTLHITPDHPVYVEGQGWLWAENLSLDDTLRRADGGMARVLAIERVALDAPQVVYNFTVKGPHTYFVLEVGVLVHNDGKCWLEWDPRVNNWRDPNTGRFANRPQGAWGDVRVRRGADELTDLEEVQILGFRGVGFSNIAPELQEQHVLIKAGHIGISFDGGKTIFGFHPHPNSGVQIEKFGTVSPVEFAKHGGGALIDPNKLPFSGGAFRGTVQNDTGVFIEANALFEKGVVGAKGKTTEVWQLDIQVSREHFDEIQAQVLREVEAGSPYPSWYRFPDRRPGVAMPRQCNNCSTWPRTQSLPIPEKTGQLSIYIDELKIAGGETIWKPK